LPPCVRRWPPWVALAAIVALAVVLVWLIVAITDTVQTRGNRRHEAERGRETREHELALAEQVTMQLDAAHGDPEVLKLIQTMQARR
jgi:membrane protein implicated in regulation of membrane protease activity